MTIQPISVHSVVLYLTPADLRERGISFDQLTTAHTLELTREAFCQAGLTPEGPLEIETYPEQCGVLVFVHIRPAQQTAWRFADFESLLAAASALREDGPDGALYCWNECFWLVLSDQENDMCAWLSEFGDQVSSDPYIVARLEEYAVPLLPANALSALQRHFHISS